MSNGSPRRPGEEPLEKAGELARRSALFTRETFREWVLIIGRASGEWSRDNVFQHAAAIGFYTLFSLAPMLIIAIAIAGLVLSPDDARTEVVEQVEGMVGPESAEAVEAAILESRPEGRNLWSTILGMLLLLVGATTVFAQLQQSLNEIWSVTARPSRSGIAVFIKTRLLSLALVLVIGFLLLVSLVFSTALATVIRYGQNLVAIPPFTASMADLVISMAVFTALFGLIFKILPDVRLRWRDVWKGALLTALLFIIGKFFISLYLSHFGPASTYGAAGAILAVIFWVYYSAMILLFGAEFTKIYTRVKGIPVRPKSTAVRLRKEIVQDAGSG